MPAALPARFFEKRMFLENAPPETDGFFDPPYLIFASTSPNFP